MIPELDSDTGYLPAGVHRVEWSEVVQRFAGNGHRARLMTGLLAACRNLAEAGCRGLLLDGSFISAKTYPGDYDGAWEMKGVEPGRLDPVLLDDSDGWVAMKEKYLGDLFPASESTSSGETYRDFFTTDRDGVEKGMVLIDLGSLP